VSKRSPDIEMFAVFDPRINLLNDLRAGEWPVPRGLSPRDASQERARREAQWPTWQMDRPSLEGWRAPGPVEDQEASGSERKDLSWVLASALFVALGVVGAGLLTVGIETGLL
jgi:hypothetical protein